MYPLGVRGTYELDDFALVREKYEPVHQRRKGIRRVLRRRPTFCKMTWVPRLMTTGWFEDRSVRSNLDKTNREKLEILIKLVHIYCKQKMLWQSQQKTGMITCPSCPPTA